MLLGRWLSILVLMSACGWGCCGPTLVSDDEIRGQEIRPYVGLLRNFSASDISIPSANSDVTLILPARGQMEFTAWQPDFKLIGYVDGKEVFCQSIRVQPRRYSHMCKSYDFLAEIYADQLPPAGATPYRSWPPAGQRFGMERSFNLMAQQQSAPMD